MTQELFRVNLCTMASQWEVGQHIPEPPRGGIRKPRAESSEPWDSENCRRISPNGARLRLIELSDLAAIVFLFIEIISEGFSMARIPPRWGSHNAFFPPPRAPKTPPWAFESHPFGAQER